MAPEHYRRRRGILDVLAEQLRTVGGLEPDLFQRQATAGFPVLILPRVWMVYEELIEDAHRVLLRRTTT
ncbi:MAG: hypothetical protein ABIQ24_00250 [Nitrospiraceae bacterium]